MKRSIVAALVLAFLFSLSMGAFAAENPLTLDTKLSADGSTITVTVKLDTKTVAESMGISYSYETNVVEPIRDKHEWLIDSVLDDFSTTDDRGVWAVTEAVDVQGDVAKLQFRVKDGMKAENASFGVVLEVQDGAGNMTQFRASNQVTPSCDHSFGAWQNLDERGHSRSCSKCDVKQTGPHNWDAGVIHVGADGSRTKVTNCMVCAAQKKEVLEEGSSQETKPTEAPEENRPQPTYPTNPPETQPKPTNPPETQPKPTEPEKPTEAPAVTEPKPVIPQDPKPTEPKPTQLPQVTPGHTHQTEAPAETTEVWVTEPVQTEQPAQRETEPTAPPMVVPAVGTQPSETMHPTETTGEAPADMPVGTKIPVGLIAAAALLILAAVGVSVALCLRKKK